MNEPLLTMQGVHTHIGAYHILRGVDLDVPEGGVTVLLGRNGAGKTTALRTAMGLWAASAGQVCFDGQGIGGPGTQRATPDIAALGVAYVPETLGLFASLSVRENMLLAARRARTLDDIDTARLEWLFGLFPALRRFWRYPAGTLSGGHKQMLAIARAMIEPRRLLLIDEPSQGLAPASMVSLIEALRELKRTRTTVLMVEQNFAMARALGDRVAVLDDGRIAWRGTMDAWADDELLQLRLLGLALGAHA